jgi:hypothetical protein
MSPTAKSGWLDATIGPRPSTGADLDRRQIRVEGDPTALRRIDGQHDVAHEHLDLAGRRRFSLEQIEVAVLDRPLWTAREQPLAVFHGLSSHGDLSDLYITEPSASRGTSEHGVASAADAITSGQRAQILTAPGAPHIAQGEKLKR